ncbi:hypothetical protein LC612_07305 [Nostoc sp. CHAB 5834]|nr:hypothetical protein [Nostoc sp. CHAB 5834]
MYDESPAFSGNIVNVLTINAISENQANRYMLHRPCRLPLGEEKNLGLGNQDSCPWRECKTFYYYEVLEAITDELGELRPS